jgi:hypothetical protein
MASRPRNGPLLAPRNEAEWAEINREEAEYHRRRSLLAASIRGGNVPERAFWS